ncbi:unnamed protein product, partial [marine sediment metagenome]
AEINKVGTISEIDKFRAGQLLKTHNAIIEAISVADEDTREELLIDLEQTKQSLADIFKPKEQAPDTNLDLAGDKKLDDELKQKEDLKSAPPEDGGIFSSLKGGGQSFRGQAPGVGGFQSQAREKEEEVAAEAKASLPFGEDNPSRIQVDGEDVVGIDPRTRKPTPLFRQGDKIFRLDVVSGKFIEADLTPETKATLLEL